MREDSVDLGREFWYLDQASSGLHVGFTNHGVGAPVSVIESTIQGDNSSKLNQIVLKTKTDHPFNNQLTGRVGT